MKNCNKINRRNFLVTGTSGLVGMTVSPTLGFASERGSAPGDTLESRVENGVENGVESRVVSPFVSEVERLAVEEPYDYHKHLSTAPVHVWERDADAVLEKGEMKIPDRGWKLVYLQQAGVVTLTAVQDFRDYLDVSHGVKIDLEGRSTLQGWKRLSRCIVAGTRDQLPGCGSTLKNPKDYEILVTPRRVIVCGYDERGVMFGLYNLEARMNFREAPFLPDDLHTVRHSLYRTRMVLSWMGWMEWPDALLSHLAHDGFDGIFVGVYTNPNGDRTTAENSTDFYARLMYGVRAQDPSRVKDLIHRASRYGLKVYTQIIYQYVGTEESESGLRRLVRDVVRDFPEISGYILLTEGFWYKKWGGGHGATKEYLQDWARNWSYAVGIVEEECHKVNPDIEILPWEYNIDFRPQNVEIKRYFVQQLPDNTIPLLTWENGKSFEIDGMQGYLRDYSISQVGPAEVTEGQIDEARKRGMRVFVNADTFSCGGQYQTLSYIPCPYQWYERYKALDRYGVDGTLESWSAGYTPNFMTEIRNWYCWSNAPSFEDLLGTISDRIFGISNRSNVLKAWDYFSQAIRLIPDTGPTWGTNNAIGNPIFLKEPQVRTATYMYSWEDPARISPNLNPYWPFTVSRLTFIPDFTNIRNNAENYARSSSGIGNSDKPVLHSFLRYLKMAANLMDKGLKLYRLSALNAPEEKREKAIREVVIAEQLMRMMESEHAILEFEDLRLKLVKERDKNAINVLLDKMECILKDEITRTELSLLAATRDSRLGFQFECDYVFTPYSLREKIKVMKETLTEYIPEIRNKKL
ncbi:MAG: hypothetical protein ACOX19_00395 [Fermentimonas sp.]